MANRRIKDLDERTTLSSGDYIATDNINGTRKVEVTKITNPINQVTQKVSNASDAYSATKAYKVGDMAIQNNTLYVCNTACSAASWAVNQNNFTATTVASELGDLNSALTWKLLGTKTGTEQLALPNDWNELEIVLTFGWSQSYGATFHFIRNMYGSNPYRLSNGHYKATTEYGAYFVDVNNGYVWLEGAFWNGQDKTSISSITVYYR